MWLDLQLRNILTCGMRWALQMLEAALEKITMMEMSGVDPGAW